jgi:transposase
VGNQLIRKYIYLYGAFCPETGEQFSMIFPQATGECMDIFLAEFANQFAGYRVIMGMDNAAWHNNCTRDSIVPLFLPAYSPELNPAEHIWQYIRENGEFKNRTFNSIQEVEDNICRAVNTLLDDKEIIKSITGFKWITNAISNNMIAA